PTLTWNVGALAASASVTCHFTVTVTGTTPISSSASVSGAQSDPIPSSNTFEITVGAGSANTLPHTIPTLSGIGLWALMLSFSGIAVLVLRRRAMR
ncbi:MAG: hypothetical protein ACRERU_09495, partial [Methylococcales bacterium]